MDTNVWQHYRFVSADNARASLDYIRNKEHMIGLERGTTYDDEAHTQWTVSHRAWKRS